MGLPEGVDLQMVVAVLVPIGAMTILLRAVPFSVRRALRRSSIVPALGAAMPVGVMTVLAVYALGQLDTQGRGWAAGCAAIVTVAIHLWRHSPGISIAAGTLTYMVLFNL